MGIRPSKKYPTKKPTMIKKQVSKLKGIFLKKSKVEKKINPKKKRPKEDRVVVKCIMNEIGNQN